MKDEIIRGLKKDGKFIIDGVGVFELLPRRQGKTFCGFRNMEGTPRFSKRVRFTSSLKFRNEICK
jgi:hypothetical protein